MVTTIAERLTKLRKQLCQHKQKGFIIPTQDSHQSEYVATCFRRRAYMTQFTGSAGTAQVTETKAQLWTDGRYFQQAERQQDSSQWTLMRSGQATTPTLDSWIVKNFAPGDTVGFDPYQMSISQFKSLQKVIEMHDITLCPLFCENLVDQIWKEESDGVDSSNDGSNDDGATSSIYPGYPSSTIFVHSTKYSGKDVDVKIQELRKSMEMNNSYMVVVSAQDEIAWQFNLRGNDVSFNPVFLSYAVITAQTVTQCVDSSRFGEGVDEKLRGFNIKVEPYENILQIQQRTVETMVQDPVLCKNNIWMDDTTTSIAQMQHILEKVPQVHSQMFCLDAPPIAQQKAIKNKVELQGMIDCHIRDSAALVQYLAWQDTKLPNIPTRQELENSSANDNGGQVGLQNEVTAADMQRKYRSQKDLFMDISFPSISSIDENGAIIHYNPASNPNPKPITSDSIYLIDSGGHYQDGTTDVTRTVYLKKPNSSQKPSEHQMEMYTQVLKGHIQLRLSVFPPSTIGPSLDILARQALWRQGLDYMHGTGHGVGSYLNVHEGPHGIAPGTRQGPITKTALCANMIVSNEPGYYEDGAFGIRIENLIYVENKSTRYQFGDRVYLGFQDLTLVPYDRKQIQVHLLTQEERDFINMYHQKCYETLTSQLQDDECALKWLREVTQAL